MTAKEILDELRTMASEQNKRVLTNHGAPPSQYGVKIGDLKKIQKKLKKNHELSLELYDTGIPEAQYLAGLIADEKKITRKQLQHWADTASWHMVGDFTVAWVAAESAHGWELALEWIDRPEEQFQTCGWSTLSSIVAIRKDETLDMEALQRLVSRVEKETHTAKNRVRYNMNMFLISAGGYVEGLRKECLRIGKKLGEITVDMGNTACKVPYAPDYIQKMIDRGVKKKKMARC